MSSRPLERLVGIRGATSNCRGGGVGKDNFLLPLGEPKRLGRMTCHEQVHLFTFTSHANSTEREAAELPFFFIKAQMDKFVLLSCHDGSFPPCLPNSSLRRSSGGKTCPSSLLLEFRLSSKTSSLVSSSLFPRRDCCFPSSACQAPANEYCSS